MKGNHYSDNRRRRRKPIYVKKKDGAENELLQ